MNPLFSRRKWLGLSAMVGLYPYVAGAESADTPALTPEEIRAVEERLGKKGTYSDKQATLSISLPRNDLSVSIAGEPTPITFGFSGWVAIKRTIDGRSAVLMGDTVLLETEVNPLISAVQRAGLEVGAIHNHFFYENPRIVFMHVHGMGTPEELAGKFAEAIRGTALTPAAQPPAKTGKPAGEAFDLPALDALVGSKAAVNGMTCKYTIGREDLRVVAMGAEMTPAIGLNSWASLAGDMAAARIAGDIAMLEGEVNEVIRTLRTNGLEVVALHHHMLGDDPRMVFLHYYGKGEARKLVSGFRAALDVLGKKHPHGH
ncbi:DUF1259 domain-containing protein [Siphonobacter aquaeclarae]|nr:DUF1259 domain-containing protein [Siphonobacter aquaeclarae]